MNTLHIKLSSFGHQSQHKHFLRRESIKAIMVIFVLILYNINIIQYKYNTISILYNITIQILYNINIIQYFISGEVTQ